MSWLSDPRLEEGVQSHRCIDREISVIDKGIKIRKDDPEVN